MFCLTARNSDGSLIDDNTLSYVGFHELAHLATDEIGHTDTYWDNFKWFLVLQEIMDYTFMKIIICILNHIVELLLVLIYFLNEITMK